MKTNSPEFNQSIKQGLTELLASNPDILRPIVEEVMEDYFFGKMLEEAAKDKKLVDKKEVMDFLNANRSDGQIS